MPITARKNKLYAAALPILGRRCGWRHARADADAQYLPGIEHAWKAHHVVGGCVQVLRGGQPAETYTAGYAVLHPARPVGADTVFRTASIAKAVCALLVMRLQTQGKLNVAEDISAFWHRPIRNPHDPDTPIPLGSLLSHTSGLLDSQLYFHSFNDNITADTLLGDSGSYLPYAPYAHFRYSNFGAGLIGTLLEARFQTSFEELIQQELFRPLQVDATFDICKADSRRMANGYRVLPPGRTPAFDARKRIQSAAPLAAPDPQRHFLLASGSLYITVGEMAKLCCVMMDGKHNGEAFIDAKSLQNMRTLDPAETSPRPGMVHGMGLFSLMDAGVLPYRVYGHQGFAYGAVNGFFFDERGNGFVSFNSGASERRVGRLSCLNRDLLQAVMLP
ncbi:MAG TPA: serine hydrolase domain-containing protein [Candidatus Limiplasma sp.]|nr:serine hydrolase domain-containing protein [Candidatus Limiplasma sp.]